MTGIDVQLASAAMRPRRFSLRMLPRSPLAVMSLCWLALVAFVGFAAPWLPLADPLTQDLASALSAPSLEHPLGTDTLGRDVLSRLAFGARTALAGAALATLVALLLGSSIGLVAGWFGGWIDGLASRIAELLFSLPAIVILLAFAAIFGRDITVSMVVFGILMSAVFLRLAQLSTRSVRNELFVDAARVSGVSSARVLFGDVVPNVLGPLIVQCSLTFGAALLVMASLGFLGLGPPPPAPEWGTMIAEASTQIFQFPWLLVPTGLVLSMTILSANLLGDAARDGDQRNRAANVLSQPKRTRRKVSASSDSRDEPEIAGPDSKSVLSVDGVRVEFGSPEEVVAVVQDVSFELRPAEVLGLVGESGSGKTMTALSVLGLLPSGGQVTQGSIRYDGEDLAQASEKVRSRIRGREIAMISQEPMVALDPSYTVRAQLIPVLRRLRGLSTKAAKARAEELLLDVGLKDPARVLSSYPFQLSGGMAQRVAIALALAGDPKVLIADEPTTALDVTVQAGILDLLRGLVEKRGMSILLVTHDLGVVADICSRVVVMQNGRLVEQAPVDEIFAAPSHPYTRALIASTPSLIEDRT